MLGSWWRRWQPIAFYRSEMGGWYLRLGRCGYHIVRCH